MPLLKNDKLLLTKDQIITSSQASKNFGKVRKKAQQEPVYVSDRSGISTVIISYEQFEQMWMELQELKEERFYSTLAERLQGKHEPIDFRASIGEQAYEDFEKIDPDCISDEDLFE